MQYAWICKRQSSPTTHLWRRTGKRRYSSYSFSTSALDGGEWSASRPGRALALGKGHPVPIVQEAGLAPEPVWTQRLEETYGDRTSFARSSSPYPETIMTELPPAPAQMCTVTQINKLRVLLRHSRIGLCLCGQRLLTSFKRYSCLFWTANMAKASPGHFKRQSYWDYCGRDETSRHLIKPAVTSTSQRGCCTTLLFPLASKAGPSGRARSEMKA
jgi:hypothetical protein